MSTTSPKKIGGVYNGPAVIPMVSGVLEGASELRLVGSGVPRADGTVITAAHVLRNLPVPAGGLCGSAYEIGGFQVSKDGELFVSEDIGWLKSSCDFEYTNKLTPISPPVGTRVVVSGFPVRWYQDYDTLSKYQGITHRVLEGELISPTGKWALPDINAMVMRIDGVWGKDIPGFSGGPCAYKNEDGDWIVFGILVRYFPDPQLSIFGQNTHIRTGKRHAMVVIAPVIGEYDSLQSIIEK